MNNPLRILVLAASLATFMAACSSSSTTPSSAAAEAGDAGGGTATATSGLCDRLGGPPGIGAKIGNIVTAAAMDPDIATYFADNVPTPQAGHPSGNDIVACLTVQLASSASCPGVSYPSHTPSGFTCRDMKTAHAALGIDRATFANFVALSGAQLAKDGVAAPDVATIVAFLDGTRADIVDPAASSLPDGGSSPRKP